MQRFDRTLRRKAVPFEILVNIQFLYRQFISVTYPRQRLGPGDRNGSIAAKRAPRELGKIGHRGSRFDYQLFCALVLLWEKDENQTH